MRECIECGVEIPDDSIQCTNCGNLIIPGEIPIGDRCFNMIDLLIKTSFLDEAEKKKNFNGLYDKIKSEILNSGMLMGASTENEKCYIFNKLALIILNLTWECRQYCDWITYMNYFKLINFEKVPENTVRIIGESIYKRLIETKNETTENTETDEIPFTIKEEQYEVLWYPIYIVLQFGTEEIVDKLLSHLKEIDNEGDLRLKIVQRYVRKNIRKEVNLETGRIEELGEIYRNEIREETVYRLEKSMEREHKAEMIGFMIGIISGFLGLAWIKSFFGILLLILAAGCFFLLYISKDWSPQAENEIKLAKEDIEKYESEYGVRWDIRE